MGIASAIPKGLWIAWGWLSATPAFPRLSLRSSEELPPRKTPVQHGALCAPATMRVAIPKSKCNSQMERVRRTLPHSLRATPRGTMRATTRSTDRSVFTGAQPNFRFKLRSSWRAPNLPHVACIPPSEQITVAMNQHARANNPRT